MKKKSYVSEKRSLSKKILFFALFLLLPVSALAETSLVDKDSKYYEAVDFIDNSEYFDDCLRYVFEANKPMSGAEFLHFIFRLKGFQKKMEDLTKEEKANIPSNIPRAACWLPSVLEAGKYGVIDLKKYHPQASINRNEAFQIFFMMEGLPTPRYYEAPVNFLDIRVNSDIWPIAQAMKKMEIFEFEESKKGFYFRPLRNVTQGEVVQFFYDYYFSYKIELEKELEKNKENQNQEITINFEGSSALEQNEAFAIFNHAYEQIINHFLETGNAKTDPDAMIYGATKGMTESLGDPYTAFFTPAEGKEFLSSVEGQFEGIGIYIEEKDGYIRVVSPLPQSPAEKAGIKSKDIILEVDGVSLEGKTTKDAAQLMLGEKGTSVKLKLKRGEEIIEVEVQREKIEFKSVVWEKQGDIPVIRITQEINTTSSEFAKAAQEITAWQEKPKGIVLDLRNNPGGLLDTAIDVCGFFLKRDSLVTQGVDKANNIEKYNTKIDPSFEAVPVVILVNNGTASASEIIAGALQEHGAQVVGLQSYGKGTAQTLIQYRDGSMLKMTIAKWLTPSGAWINGVGITPDFVVQDDPDTEKDEQLEKALELLEK